MGPSPSQPVVKTSPIDNAIFRNFYWIDFIEKTPGLIENILRMKI